MVLRLSGPLQQIGFIIDDEIRQVLFPDEIGEIEVEHDKVKGLDIEQIEGLLSVVAAVDATLVPRISYLQPIF